MEDLKKVAANPLTPSDVLTELSKHDDYAIRYLVASNPNTPEQTLIHLSKEFPNAIAENPVVELLKLENPNGYFTRLSLARDRKTSPEILAKLISRKIEDAEICRAAARNPNTPAAALVDLVHWTSYVDDTDSFFLYDVCQEIINNPLLTETCMERALNSSSDHCWKVFVYGCTQLSNLSFDIIERLSRHSDYYGYLLVDLPVVHKSSIILDNIARHWLCDEDEDTLIKILKNPVTSASTLEYIAAHDSLDVGNLVVNHPNVSAKALNIVSFVRGKSDISIELLEELVEQPRFNVLSTICMYPNTPLKLLEKTVDKLFDSKPGKYNLTVLENLITHPYTSAKILLKLLEKLNHMFVVKDGKVIDVPDRIIHKVKEKLDRV